MTTPERLRRRQRFEGAGLAFLGVMVVVSTIASDARDDDQDKAFRECITDQVRGIGSYLDERSTTTEATNDTITKVILGVATTFPRNDLEGLSDALDAYIDDQKQIKALRENTPVPKFPSGRCE